MDEVHLRYLLRRFGYVEVTTPKPRALVLRADVDRSGERWRYTVRGWSASQKVFEEGFAETRSGAINALLCELNILVTLWRERTRRKDDLKVVSVGSIEVC